MKLKLSDLKKIISEEVSNALNEEVSNEDLLKSAEEHLYAALRALNGILGKDLDNRDEDVQAATLRASEALEFVQKHKKQ